MKCRICTADKPAIEFNGVTRYTQVLQPRSLAFLSRSTSNAFPLCAARATRAVPAGREAGLGSHIVAARPLQRASAGFLEVLLFKKGRCSNRVHIKAARGGNPVLVDVFWLQVANN